MANVSNIPITVILRQRGGLSLFTLVPGIVMRPAMLEYACVYRGDAPSGATRETALYWRGGRP